MSKPSAVISRIAMLEAMLPNFRFSDWANEKLSQPWPIKTPVIRNMRPEFETIVVHGVNKRVMAAWLDENCPETRHFTNFSGGADTIQVRFASDDDRVLFRLKWL